MLLGQVAAKAVVAAMLSVLVAWSTVVEVVVGAMTMTAVVCGCNSNMIVVHSHTTY